MAKKEPNVKKVKAAQKKAADAKKAVKQDVADKKAKRPSISAQAKLDRQANQKRRDALDKKMKPSKG